MTKVVEVEESQNRSLSYKQAHALWDQHERQVTTKLLANLALAGVEPVRTEVCSSKFSVIVSVKPLRSKTRDLEKVARF